MSQAALSPTSSQLRTTAFLYHKIIIIIIITNNNNNNNSNSNPLIGGVRKRESTALVVQTDCGVLSISVRHAPENKLLSISNLNLNSDIREGLVSGIPTY